MPRRFIPILAACLLGSAGAIAPLLAIANVSPTHPKAFLPSLSLISQLPFSLAQNPRRPGGFASPPGWLKDLNLSPDQLQKIRAIRSQYQPRLKQERQASQQAQKELRELMSSNALAETIRRKFNQAQTLHRQYEETRIESMIAIRNVLTDAQRQKLAEIMQQKQKSTRDRAIRDPDK